ncbi:hypothetical protein L1887_38970 [Cichorium endivia]|nr:hypothetical protein L1887_38970 [Cichorium endivia]
MCFLFFEEIDSFKLKFVDKTRLNVKVFLGYYCKSVLGNCKKDLSSRKMQLISVCWLWNSLDYITETKYNIYSVWYYNMMRKL